MTVFDLMNQLAVFPPHTVVEVQTEEGHTAPVNSVRVVVDPVFDNVVLVESVDK